MVATPLVCSSCDVGINADEVVAGLAVRIDGDLLCSTCVESLPSQTQVGINRIRALRGLNVTTYRVLLARLPRTALYTFTTSIQQNVHRRELAATGAFSAPLLAPPSPPVKAVDTLQPSPAPATAATVRMGKRRGRRSLRIGLGVGVGVLLLGGAAIGVAASGSRPSQSTAPPAALPTALAKTEEPQRARSASATPVAPKPAAPTPAPVARMPVAKDDPLAAWRAAEADATCPPPVLAALAADVVEVRTAQLDAAERALASGRLEEARLRLRAMRLPTRPAFADLAAREAALDVRLTPPAPTAAPAVVVAQPPAPPPSEPPAPTRPGSECWLIAVGDLPGDAGSAGTLERLLPAVSGGDYQLWVRAKAPRRGGPLSCAIGEVESQGIGPGEVPPGAWVQLRPTAGSRFALAAGAHPLRLKLASSRWLVHELYLAGTGFGPPTDDAARTSATSPWPKPLTAVGDPGSPPTPTPAAGHIASGSVSEWLPSFAFPQRAVEDAKDGSVLLPSPWPMGISFFYRALKPAGARRYALALEIPAAKVAGGGVALLLHRGNAARLALAATLNHGTTSTPLAPLVLDKGWQMIPLALPTDAVVGDQLVLRLEDVDDKPYDRGFLLGKVVLVAGRTPTPADLGLRPAPLQGDDPLLDAEARTRFRALLANVQARRPAKARTLAVDQLALALPGVDKDTVGALRHQLLPFLGRELQRELIVDLDFTASGWEDRQFSADGPIIAPETTSVVALCPNGREAAALTQPEAFSTWLQRQISAMVSGDARGRRGGLLPVVVVGPLAPDGNSPDPASLETLWTKARSECLRLGIPLIDLRPAQTADTDGPGQRQIAGDLLVEGLRTLAFQLMASQRPGR